MRISAWQEYVAHHNRISDEGRGGLHARASLIIIIYHLLLLLSLLSLLL